MFHQTKNSDVISPFLFKSEMNLILLSQQWMGKDVWKFIVLWDTQALHEQN